MRVLIVEDDNQCRLVLERLIESHVDCDSARDGEEALEKFQEAHAEGLPYELIFLDIMMPKLDGQEVLNAIRDIEQSKRIDPDRSVKVVMTTALDDAEQIFEAHVSGCSNYLLKPISKTKVLEQLRLAGCTVATPVK